MTTIEERHGDGARDREVHRGDNSLDRAGEAYGPAIVPLDQPEAAIPQLMGSKAANLARAARAGLPVLPGFVIPYRAGGDMVALRRAWDELSEGGARPLVVRSSSPQEDTEESSLAGQFTSVLDVRGWRAFRTAVQTVLDSAHRADGSTAPMAVLVQPMLTARVGGVMFGADPVAGRADRMLVSAVRGGPDSLVSGVQAGTDYWLSEHGRLLRTEASGDSGTRAADGRRTEVPGDPGVEAPEGRRTGARGDPGAEARGDPGTEAREDQRTEAPDGRRTEVSADLGSEARGDSRAASSGEPWTASSEGPRRRPSRGPQAVSSANPNAALPGNRQAAPSGGPHAAAPSEEPHAISPANPHAVASGDPHLAAPSEDPHPPPPANPHAVASGDPHAVSVQGGTLLTRAELFRLARLARRVRLVFGGPQDVEFGFDAEGRLWLFQSRPITAMAARPARGARLLGPGPVAETLPDQLAPLEEDLWVAPMARGLAAALDIGGTAPRRLLKSVPVVTTVAGRAAADLRLLGAVPPRHRWLALLNPAPGARRLVAAWRVGRLASSLPGLATDLVADVDRRLAEIPPPSGLSSSALAAELRWTRRALVSLRPGGPRGRPPQRTAQEPHSGGHGSRRPGRSTRAGHTRRPAGRHEPRDPGPHSPEPARPGTTARGYGDGDTDDDRPRRSADNGPHRRGTGTWPARTARTATAPDDTGQVGRPDRPGSDQPGSDRPGSSGTGTAEPTATGPASPLASGEPACQRYRRPGAVPHPESQRHRPPRSGTNQDHPHPHATYRQRQPPALSAAARPRQAGRAIHPAGHGNQRDHFANPHDRDHPDQRCLRHLRHPVHRDHPGHPHSAPPHRRPVRADTPT
ncbi:PEP/pyruvate-binding domain-containing protein [Streptomyces bicolor]|uniref:PEP/pyruvate-binding domain-containing protein n=1 Tax=Streptomyces bicolor TaxID=66874 RepID=UPI001F3622C8|nr:PEP/pyruvate-binding domain-containing protein [Streptomyces bicolor]